MLYNCSSGESNINNDIKWIYDKDKIWDIDSTHMWNGIDPITSGIVECPKVRSISGRIPGNGTLSFSWTKTNEGTFEFYRNNNSFPDEICHDYDCFGLFKNYSVREGDMVKWRFSLPSPPCRLGQCWLLINYSTDWRENNTTIPPTYEPTKFEVIYPTHVCRQKHFHAYIIIETPTEIDGVKDFEIGYSEGIQIKECFGVEGFFMGLSKGQNGSYESSVSIPQKRGKMDLIFNIPSNIDENNFFINISKIELISGKRTIPLNPKNISIDIPNEFLSDFPEEYANLFPDHKENIECLWDCVFDGNT